jgi:hypothetical protein
MNSSRTQDSRLRSIDKPDLDPSVGKNVTAKQVLATSKNRRPDGPDTSNQKQTLPQSRYFFPAPFVPCTLAVYENDTGQLMPTPTQLGSTLDSAHELMKKKRLRKVHCALCMKCPWLPECRPMDRPYPGVRFTKFNFIGEPDALVAHIQYVMFIVLNHHSYSPVSATVRTCPKTFFWVASVDRKDGCVDARTITTT